MNVWLLLHFKDATYFLVFPERTESTFIVMASAMANQTEPGRGLCRQAF